MPAYALIVNGQSRRVEAGPGTPLLWVLREVGNAIFAPTGKRIRRLPIQPADLA